MGEMLPNIVSVRFLLWQMFVEKARSPEQTPSQGTFDAFMYAVSKMSAQDQEVFQAEIVDVVAMLQSSINFPLE